MNSDFDPEIAALFEPSYSDESVLCSSDSDMSMDNEFDEDDVEDSSGASDDDKQDPDYEPLEFRLNSKVAKSRVDVTRKMTIQNLAGDDTVVTFRPEKHGEGF
ncbi:hypothetical protein Hdeb2414_s0001g00017721 [Helianthus debilis subsp. tardiflorus]